MYDKNVDYEEVAWYLLYEIENILNFNKEEVVELMKECRFHEDDIKEYLEERQ